MGNYFRTRDNVKSIEMIDFITEKNSHLDDVFDFPLNSSLDNLLDFPIDDLREFSDIPLIHHEFKISFGIEAVELFKRLSEVLEIHSVFRDIVGNSVELPLLIPEFDRIFEQKLAMYISLCIRDRIEKKWLNGNIYIVTEEDVIIEINKLIKFVMNEALNSFPSENTIKCMLDGYPITLLSKICNSKPVYAHIMGESIRCLVELRATHKNWVPLELAGNLEGNTPLTGDPKSPLDDMELDALYRYIGIRKSMYIHILLNSLFEFNQHNIYIQKCIMTENEIITICKSTWFYLFLFAYEQNIAKREFMTNSK